MRSRSRPIIYSTKPSNQTARRSLPFYFSSASQTRISLQGSSSGSNTPSSSPADKDLCPASIYRRSIRTVKMSSGAGSSSSTTEAESPALLSMWLQLRSEFTEDEPNDAFWKELSMWHVSYSPISICQFDHTHPFILDFTPVMQEDDFSVGLNNERFSSLI